MSDNLETPPPRPEKSVRDFIAEAEAAERARRLSHGAESKLAVLSRSPRLWRALTTVVLVLMFLPLACYLLPSREVATGDYEGVHERSRGLTVVGWVWDKSAPRKPISVTLDDGKNPPVEILADHERADLAKRGIGNGRHGF